MKLKTEKPLKNEIETADIALPGIDPLQTITGHSSRETEPFITPDAIDAQEIATATEMDDKPNTTECMYAEANIKGSC